MRQVKALIALSFVIVFAIVSCSKEGSTGPAGPAGPAGAAGAAGPAGPKGDTGVANVIYSPWLDATYIADTGRTTAGVLDTAGYYFDQAAPKLTNAILTSGEIKVYINLNSASAPNIVPVPYFDPYSFISINPTYSAGNIDLYSTVDVSTYTETNIKYQQWRYIFIPGGKPARYGVDWNNYAEVKKFLNLPD